MAVFKINALADWLPPWLPSNGTVEKIRCHCKDGTKMELTPDEDGEFEVSDSRSIRHLEVDPRFTRIS